jgi:hypothetical protein
VGLWRSRLDRLNESQPGWFGLRVLGLAIVIGLVLAVVALRGPSRGEQLVSQFVRCSERAGYVALTGAAERRARADFEAGLYQPGDAGWQLGGDPPDAAAELVVSRTMPRRYLLVARPGPHGENELPHGSRLVLVPAAMLARNGGELPVECTLTPPGTP